MGPALKAPNTHLEFYLERGVSPVHQDISDLARHLDRRRSLYRSLGVLPKLIEGARVLEVAPGSGHNSIFIASCKPQQFTMVEPNPVAVREIEELYGQLDIEHTTPDVVQARLEDFTPDHPFDLVICEGWLGSAAHEQTMLTKLGGFVCQGGVLCVSLVSPIGLLANTLRRILAVRLCPDGAMEERLAPLLAAFGPHLATLADMSRPHEDWIVDNMINPAWYGVCLTPAMTVKALEPSFDHFGFSPKFICDWRWYKSLYGGQRRFNSVFLESFYSAAHNLLDYREIKNSAHPDHAREIEAASTDLLEAAMSFEYNNGSESELLAALARIQAAVQPVSPNAGAAVAETIAAFSKPAITPADVAGMTALAPFFGREMMYASYTKER